MTSENFVFWQGHGDGLTDVCFNAAANTVLTSGADGSIKVWSEFNENEKPKCIKICDTLYALSTKGDTVYVATDNNTVDKYSISEGTQEGVLFRFTSNPTHVALSESQNLIAGCSSDFTVKTIQTETDDQKEFIGHRAPVLSVSIDPLDEFLATTSCDGDFRIWNISNATAVKIIPVVKPSNDVCNSESLCRISWRPATGEDIAVPSGNEIKVFSRGTWTLMYSFKTALTNKPFNCCGFSPCGRFLAAATTDGWLCVWDAETQDCLQTVQNNLKSCITCAVWDPRENNTIAVADSKGQVGILKEAVPSKTKSNQNSIPDDLDALFENEEGDLNDFFDDAAEESESSQNAEKQTKLNNDDAKVQDEDLIPDDFEIPSTNKLFAVENDLAPPEIPSTAKPRDDDVTSSVSELLADEPSQPQDQKQIYKGPAPTPMQPAFQPSSTPLHLSHRFMVWNSVGTIRSYTDEMESAIDVEFHDKQHHYALHFNNESPNGGPYHTMADLSMNAVALAAESTDDSPSKLSVTYYASWEGNKDWTIEMPDDEDIKALTIGESWVAVCTDSRLVRMFSLAGMQRSLFSIPGPVVTMAAHTDQLMVVYHTSQGFNGNQCLGYMLLEVGLGTGANRPKKIVGGDPLPISKKTSLQWAGFTAEGTPVTVDTVGVVRMMNRGFCSSWSPVLYLNKLTKSRHDHYWVVALHENPQDVRAIMCKGSAYPSTLPRPFPTVLQYKLPLCEADSEKSKFEEEYWRTRLMSSHSDFLESHGFETDEKHKQSVKVLLQQTLMKMFALACKLDKESRAFEVCELMPSASSVNLAIKYASRVKKMVLAQKLGEVAQEKTQEEMQALLKMHRQENDFSGDEEEESDDFRRNLAAGYSQASTEWAEHKKLTIRKKVDTRKDVDVEEMDEDSNDKGSPAGDSDIDNLPDLTRKPSQPVTKLTGSSRNPFKKKSDPPAKMPLSQVSTSSEVSEANGPKSVLDNIPRKSSAQKLRGVIAKSHNTSKKVSKDFKKQQTLFGAKSKFQRTSTPKGKGLPVTSQEEQPNVGEQILRDIRNECTSGVLLYVSEVRQKLAAEHSDLDSLDIRKMAIADFKKLPAEERQAWNDRAKRRAGDKPIESAKRKLEDGDCVEIENVPEDNELPAGKLRKTEELSADDASSKLAAFAYGDED